MCNSNDLKAEFVGINNVLEVIVNELNELESRGIETITGEILKGGLFNMIFDNLGANMCLGLNESFNSHYYCRICLQKKEVCQRKTREDLSTMRTRAHYDDILVQIKRNADIDPKNTFGIKSPCVLNSLKSFHFVQSPSLDIMHDILEGVVPFALENLFRFCIDRKIVSYERLENRILMFKYMSQFKKSVPRKIHMGKKNLNLSATQTYCLILHLPFILSEFRAALLHVWKPMETLLQIIRILFSRRVEEADLQCLTELIHMHLQSIIDIFNVNLTPKHHLLTHYPNVIRKMGPVISCWAMRMEGKHQSFKRIVRQTNNFINLNKTMAEKHQQMSILGTYPYRDEICTGKIEKFDSPAHFHEYLNMLEVEFNTTEIDQMGVLSFNGITYKIGNLICLDNIFFEIDHILMIQGKFVFLSNVSYIMRNFDLYYNSLMIETNANDLRFFRIESLINKNCYEKYNADQKMHIVLENLDLHGREI